jgi:hypothetical protein
VKDILRVWQGATCMKENETKREGQLLGKLNRERDRAPKGVIARDAWIEDGQTIRALGVPMGNDFDIEEWYRSRYRTVKARVSLWPSIRRLSLKGNQSRTHQDVRLRGDLGGSGEWSHNHDLREHCSIIVVQSSVSQTH